MISTQLKFVVFVLNKYAKAKKMAIATVYNQFDSLGILDDYIIQHYEVLHTLGKNYLIEDLSELVNQKMKQNDTLSRL